jgi:pimeloyl-ACP methyl ester carboxylesterase
LRVYAEALTDALHVVLPHRNGYSETGVHEWNPAAEVEALRGLVDVHAIVVGHSFGSFRAFELAVEYPEVFPRVLALGPIAGLPEQAREAVEGLVTYIRSGADLSEAAAQRWVAARRVERLPLLLPTVRATL